MTPFFFWVLLTYGILGMFANKSLLYPFVDLLVLTFLGSIIGAISWFIGVDDVREVVSNGIAGICIVFGFLRIIVIFSNDWD